MSPRPPGGSLNRKNCPNEPTSTPSHVNFCHPQFPQHMQFSQPPYAMNIPFQQLPQQPMYPPNVHYVVVQPQYAPYSLPPPLPPPQPALVMPSTSVSDSGTPHVETCPEEQGIDNVDNDDSAEPERTARRLAWTEKEDIRLISAWLNCSKIKKYDMYWANVAAAYNSTTPRDRRREAKHLKCHWHKITKKIACFDDCWCQVKAKYPSSLSDNMQLMDKTWVMLNEEARAIYLEEENHRFAFDHCWKAVWDQPKWKAYISSLSSKTTKLSESGDYTSSTEDTEDDPEEMDEQGCATAKEIHEGKGKMSSLSEVEKDIECSVGLQNTLKVNEEEMTGVQLMHSDQNLELSRLEQTERVDNGTFISENQQELLMADAAWLNEFQPGSELLAGNSKFSELQRGRSLREDVPKNGTLGQGYKELDYERATVRENIPEKEKGPQVCNKREHGKAVRGNAPQSETPTQSCKAAKLKRKRKGKSVPCSSEVQEDIKRAVDLQIMLTKDREKMSEVQLRLSKEKLEFAKLKQQEAKDKKETTLYEKYSELLMSDTSRFNEFQKAEYEKAVRHMGEMLFGRDDN